MTSVAVLIVTWNNERTITACLDSLARQECATPVRVYVWDNDSADDTASIVAGRADVTLVRASRNEGFARGVNRLAARCDEPLLLLVNPDTELDRGAISALVATIETGGEAIVGGRLESLEGEPQLAAARPFPRSAGLCKWIVSRRAQTWALPQQQAHVDAVSGAFMLVPRSFWDAVGGLDEGYPHAGEDLELCLDAARRGVPVLYQPAARAFHEREASVVQAPAEIDVLRWVGMVRFAASYEGRPAAALLRGVVMIYALAVIVATALGVRRSARSLRRARLLLRWAVLREVPAHPAAPVGTA